MRGDGDAGARRRAPAMPVSRRAPSDGDQVEALAADADKGHRGRVQMLAQARADRLQQLALVSRRLADAQDRDQLVGERIGHRIDAVLDALQARTGREIERQRADAGGPAPGVEMTVSRLRARHATTPSPAPSARARSAAPRRSRGRSAAAATAPPRAVPGLAQSPRAAASARMARCGSRAPRASASVSDRSRSAAFRSPAARWTSAPTYAMAALPTASTPAAFSRHAREQRHRLIEIAEAERDPALEQHAPHAQRRNIGRGAARSRRHPRTRRASTRRARAPATRRRSAPDPERARDAASAAPSTLSASSSRPRSIQASPLRHREIERACPGRRHGSRSRALQQ